MTPIEMITPSLLALVVARPRPVGELEPWSDAIRKAAAKYEINTIRRVAAFIAQMAHESDFLPRDENLNYSVEGLVKNFSRSRISMDDCIRLGRSAAHPADQIGIANALYGGEWGRVHLGNTEPGDGWLCRGGGPLQATGRDNYTRFGRSVGMSLPQAISYVRGSIEGGVMFAAWFWEENDINRLADTPGVTDESKRINGGVMGLADRKTRFDKLVDAMLKLERRNPS